MPSPIRRSLDGLLAIGPHPLDAQLCALAEYARRTAHALEVFWAMLPGEDPATDAPATGFPVVVFDDEIAGFTPEERAPAGEGDAGRETGITDWHVAHAAPQPKRPTSHLPVYGCACDGETPADAILCIGAGSLDLQLARIEAYAIRSAARLRGVYVASDADNLQVLLRDFRVCNRTLAAGPILTVGARGEVVAHE